MPPLLAALLAYPTVIFTALMALVLLYWLFVILGALDVDALHAKAGVLDAAAAKAGAIDAFAAKAGAIDALAAKGEAADGLLDAVGAKDGVVDGAVEGGAEGGDGGDGADHAASGLLHALNLRRAPVTVTFSLLVFFGWIASFLAMTYLGPVASVALPEWLVGTLALVGSLLLAVPLTSLATKPLEPVFRKRPGKTRSDFVGSLCRIETGRVDDKVGQATLEDGGAGLIIQVRGEAGKLKRGQQALIVEYDAEREAYLVEAYDALIEAENAEKKAPARGK